MYTTEGIVLKKVDSGEADAFFVLYTKDFGKMRALAQGVKKEAAKLKGHLETFNFASLQFVLGKNGERLTSASLLNHWPQIRGDFKKLAAAHYVAELIEKHCFPGDRDSALWDLIAGVFLTLEGADSGEQELAGVLRSFENGFWEHLGYVG